MGFTGSLVLTRTQTALTDLDPLTGLEIELVGHRADHWQLAAIDGHLPDLPSRAAALVNATAAPALVA